MDSILRDYTPWVMGAVVGIFWIGVALMAHRIRSKPPKRRRRTKYRLIEPDVAFQDAAVHAAANHRISIGPVSFDDQLYVYVEGYPPFEGETADAYRARVGKELGVKFGEFASIDVFPLR